MEAEMREEIEEERAKRVTSPQKKIHFREENG